jgi:hypothetical protein
MKAPVEFVVPESYAVYLPKAERHIYHSFNFFRGLLLLFERFDFNRFEEEAKIKKEKQFLFIAVF